MLNGASVWAVFGWNGGLGIFEQINNWSRRLQALLVHRVCVGCRLSLWFIWCQNVCWEPRDRQGLRGSQGGLLTAEKQCQSRSQTTGERLRSQARLIDILTYCTFPERGLPWGKHYCLTAPSPGFEPLNVKQISGEAQRQLIRPVCLRGGRCENRDLEKGVTLISIHVSKGSVHPCRTYFLTKCGGAWSRK